jgi:hypothetical protein
MSFVTNEPHTQSAAAGGHVLEIGSKVAAEKFRKYGLGPPFFINKFRIPVLRGNLDSGMQDVR